MKNSDTISLPHLTNEMFSGARKTKLCAYAVALEGWRRGLELKWYTSDSEHFSDMIVFGVNPPGRLFSLSSEERTHYFFRTRGDKVTNEAVEIGSDKDETKLVLSKAGVPVPEGHMFAEDASDDEIINLATKVGFPMVLKPTNGSLGKGVMTNIKNERELKKALHYVRIELEYDEVMIERYVPGEEYRVYVVEDKVIGAYHRVPANIIGDGIHTIEELIEFKNKERRKNPRLFSCLIEIDLEMIDFLNASGYSLDSIPPKEKRIFLMEKSNISAGGDPIAVTDKLPGSIKSVALNAMKAVPGLYHGGVDIIIEKNKPIEEAPVVIELNPTAQIGGILFPMKGNAGDIPAAIIDYYFPETKGLNKDISRTYFDLNTVLEPLQSRSAIEVEVLPAPLGKVYAKKFTVSGNVQRVAYQQWLRNQALVKRLNGFVNNLADGNIEVVLAATDKKQLEEFRHFMAQGYNVKVLREEIWEEPVKVGFEINESFNENNLRSIEIRLRKLEKQKNRMEKDRRRTERDNIMIEQSRSWRLTMPIRKMGEWLKNLFQSRSAT